VRHYYTYILASNSKRLYVGMTGDLVKRMYYHLTATDSFVVRYRVTRLVYFEIHRHPMNAIVREKQIKRWRRARKIALIEATNPFWEDLAEGWLDPPLA
jgi:putative endonuclease